MRVRLGLWVGSCNGQGGAFGSWGTSSLQVSRGSRGHDNWPGTIIPRGGPVRKRSNVFSPPSRSPRKVPPQFGKWLQRLEKVEGCQSSPGPGGAAGARTFQEPGGNGFSTRPRPGAAIGSGEDPRSPPPSGPRWLNSPFRNSQFRIQNSKARESDNSGGPRSKVPSSIGLL